MEQFEAPINDRVVILLDRSGSMADHTEAVEKVVDGLVQHLREQTGYQTRLSLYVFDDVVDRIIADTDVMRVPSIKGKFVPRGMTALQDATLHVIHEVAALKNLGPEEQVVIYVISDGLENRSRKVTPAQLATAIKGLPAHWTIGALVPSFQGAVAAKKCGFPPGNVDTWNAGSAKGMEEVKEKITTSHTALRTMTKTTGKLGTKHLFAPDVTKINDDAVNALGMTPVKGSKYDLLTITTKEEEKKRIIDYFAENSLPWRLGHNFYELVRDERISPDKELALVKTGNGAQIVYIDEKIRGLLNLPDDQKVLVAPGLVPGWGIFVQSKNAGRFMRPGRLLIRK